MKRTMLPMTCIAAMLATLLIVVQPAGAGCPTFRSSYRAPIYSAPVYHAPVYHAPVKEVIVEKVFNFARIVEIPVFSTYLGVAPYGHAQTPLPHSAPQQKSECADAIAGFKAMQTELAQLKAQLAKPQQPPQAEPDPLAPQALKAKGGDTKGRVASVISTRCASCHDDKTAKVDGDGVVLVNTGKVKDFTPDELGAIIKYVSTKGCPKKSKASTPMGDAERLEFIADLTILASSDNK
jgi:cytochrome c5